MRKVIVCATVPDEAGKYFKSDEELVLFWSRVDTRGAEECWPWKGPTLKSGYATFRVGRQLIPVHHLAFQDVGGAAGASVIRHTCKTRSCANPAHLVGTSSREELQAAIREGRFEWVNGKLRIVDRPTAS